jgi:SAM-dependent methyltransferase
MKYVEHNRLAWNQMVGAGNKWTVPVSREVISRARNGEYSIVLTPYKSVPREWLGDVKGKRILCLASGGGQQGPVLSAAGGVVTVLDNSDEQLRRDRMVAEDNGLSLETVQGNMQDLRCFSDGQFDMVVHPVSNAFVDDVLPVWRECYRVLRPQGVLLSGFANPIEYMIDWEDADVSHVATLKNAIPYADCDSLPKPTIERYIRELQPFEYGHSLTSQIGGQISAGFLIQGFYEDKGEPLLDQFTDVFIATNAIKT